jgi:hypothetical protein
MGSWRFLVRFYGKSSLLVSGTPVICALLEVFLLLAESEKAVEFMIPTPKVSTVGARHGQMLLTTCKTRRMSARPRAQLRDRPMM